MYKKIIGVVLGFFIFNLLPPFVYSIINGDGLYQYMTSHVRYNNIFFNVAIMAPYYISFSVGAFIGGVAGWFFLKDRTYYLLALLCMITSAASFLFSHYKKDSSDLIFLFVNSLLVLLIFWAIRRLAPKPFSGVAG